MADRYDIDDKTNGSFQAIKNAKPTSGFFCAGELIL